MATHDLKREPQYSTKTPQRPVDPDTGNARPTDDLPNPAVPNPEAHSTPQATRPAQVTHDAHPHVRALVQGERRHVFLVSDDGRLAASSYVEQTFALASREGVPYVEVHLTGHEALPDDTPAAQRQDDRPREVRQHEDAPQDEDGDDE